MGINISLNMEGECSMIQSNGPKFTKKKTFVRALFRSDHCNLGNTLFHLVLLTFPIHIIFIL